MLKSANGTITFLVFYGRKIMFEDATAENVSRIRSGSLTEREYGRTRGMELLADPLYSDSDSDSQLYP